VTRRPTPITAAEAQRVVASVAAAQAAAEVAALPPTPCCGNCTAFMLTLTSPRRVGLCRREQPRPVDASGRTCGSVQPTVDASIGWCRDGYEAVEAAKKEIL
jgi:hypothetical protein